MAIFSLTGYGEEKSTALIADAYALSTYSYHNFSDGFSCGYQQYGFGAGLPLTFIKALFGNTASQGIISGIPWNPDSEAAAQEKTRQAGWSILSAEELGYQGKTNAHGTFYGEKAGYSTNQAEIMGKYDDSGNLIQIGIAFRGTGAPRGESILDTVGDVVNDIKAALFPADYSNNFTYHAFGNLLEKVADYTQKNGLSGNDVVVTGHSLGGLLVNSVSALSESCWNGFYADAACIALASPTQTENGKVLNIGFENDPVFRVLNGTDFTWETLGVHDTPHDSSTDNIVNFNDFYASTLWGLTPLSILNPASWLSHMPFFYETSLSRIINSEFYALMERDSTVITANLSDAFRENTWVTDLNKSALPHSGPTFILGSEGNDLLAGGEGNDYLEGGAGNDTFRDAGGYNIILGGEGDNKLDLRHALNDSEVAWDGSTLYLREADGGLTLAQDIHTLRSRESFMWLWSQNKDHQVTSEGLRSGNLLTLYADSTTGDADANSLTANKAGSWLFGLQGDDVLTGAATGGTTFVGGEGDDTLHSHGSDNSFLFTGNFGNDVLYGYNASDKLIFMGVAGATEENSLTFDEGNAIFSFGENSVTLVGINQNIFADGHIIVA